jgi:hypothetical protein
MRWPLCILNHSNSIFFAKNMKNILHTTALVLLMVINARAQNEVTFLVNMTNETVNPNGVHVAGNWQSEAGLPSDWEPFTAQMTDDDNDGVYAYTCLLPDGVYEYKFINGNAWGSDEVNIPAICQVGGGNTNRFFAVDGGTPYATTPIFYNGSSATDAGVTLKPMRFSVEMPTSLTIDPTGVYVSGTFMNEFSNGIFTDWIDKIKIYDINAGDGAANYTGIVYYPEDVSGTFNYSFFNGATQELLPTACQGGSFPTRFFTLNTTSELTPKFCFASCDVSCLNLSAYNATINVDMRYRCDFDVNSNDSVDVAGTFNEYQGGPAYLLADGDNDGIYSITLPLQAGEFQYKARIIRNGNFSSGWEGGNNTIVNLNSNLNLAPRCFGQASGTCTPIPDPSEVTFRVEFQSETPANEVYVMGDFTNPPYQGGALLMNQVGANVFEVSTEICPGAINYKFINGIISVSENIESYPGITDLSCLTSNGIGGYNRFYARQSADPVLLSFVYNSCSTGLITTTEAIRNSRISVYPNPANSTFTVQSGSTQISTIKVLDLAGKVVLNQPATSVVDCGSIAAGYYMVVVQQTDGEVLAVPLVIE